MSVTIPVRNVGPEPNIENVWPFDRVLALSGQVTGDATSGAVLCDLSLLTSGRAAHVYLLGIEYSTADGLQDGDVLGIQRSVNPQWNFSRDITTGLSTIAVMQLRKASDQNIIGIAPGQIELPKYVGQVTSAGSSLIRSTVALNTNGAIYSMSWRIGIAQKFITTPPNMWPLF